MADKNYTHLVLVADRSGSMLTIAKDADGGIEALLKEQALIKGRLTVDVVTFDHTIEYKHTRVGPLDVTYPIVEPRGTTALNDAIGVSVETTKKWIKGLSKAERPAKVLFVIATDGMENASHEFTAAQVKALVTEQQDKGWEFIFLAANIDAFVTGRGYGFAAHNTSEYVADAVGTRGVYATASAAVTASRTGA